MDENYDGLGQSIEIKSLETRVTRTIRLQHHVSFTFKFETVFRKFLLEESRPLPVYLGEDRVTEPPAAVTMAVRGADCNKPDNPIMREILERFIGSKWPLSDENRGWLLERALEEAREILKAQKFYLCVDLEFGLVLEEDRYYQRARGGSGNGNGNGMVPAVDSAIRSLKEYEGGRGGGGDESGCSICLEEFPGRDGEVSGRGRLLCMPCEHVFHGECIQKWLKISHYCPICRYEMPTN